MGININVPNRINQNTPLHTVRSGATADTDNNVKYVPQTLTEAQQAQARQNIGAGVPQVQADWNQNDTTAPDYIKNKPEITPGGGATVNEFHYKRGGGEGEYYYYIDCPGYTPAEGDLMIVIFDWIMDPTAGCTLRNGTDVINIDLRNAPSSEYNYYDDIYGTPNTRWTVKLEKDSSDNWHAYNISTIEFPDWNVTDEHAVGYIKNKPSLPEDVILEDLPSAMIVYTESTNTLRMAAVGTIDTPTDVYHNGIYYATVSGNGGQDIALAKGKNVFVAKNRTYSHMTLHNFSIVDMTKPVWMYVNMAEYAVIQYTESQPNLFCVIKDATDDIVWMMKSQSTYFMMNNRKAMNFMYDGADKIVFTDYTIPVVDDLLQATSTTLYVPNVRKTEFMTMLNNTYQESDIATALTHVAFYDFLSKEEYRYRTITLPTLPLTMTDANGNTIDGDFVANNITITPAV